MPLTHAERQKRYREKQKEKYGENAVKEKESRRRKEKRQQNIELNREKDRIRKQRSRLNKALKTVTTSPAYKAVSTLSEAVPKSPRKRGTVVKKLSMEAGCLEVAYPQKQEGPTSLPEHLKADVTDFYMRDDISTQAPSKRDSIAVRENNVKKTMQKRHLSMNISEVYQIRKSR